MGSRRRGLGLSLRLRPGPTGQPTRANLEGNESRDPRRSCEFVYRQRDEVARVWITGSVRIGTSQLHPGFWRGLGTPWDGETFRGQLLGVCLRLSWFGPAARMSWRWGRYPGTAARRGSWKAATSFLTLSVSENFVARHASGSAGTTCQARRRPPVPPHPVTR